MNQIYVARRIQFILLATAVLVTLVVTPKTSFDSVNLPKQAILIVGATSSFFLLLIALRRVAHKLLYFLITLFCFWIVVVLVFSGPSVSMQLWGTFGRNTGALTYISFSLILICAVEIFTTRFGKRILYSLAVVGVLNSIYAILQSLDLDFLYSGQAQFKVFGTAGNPNFLSALLGMSAIAIASLGLDSHLSMLRKVGFGILLSTVVYGLVLSSSRQGFAILCIGIMVLIYLKFVRNGGRIPSMAFISLTLLGGIFSILGFLQKGPLASILYEDTISLRGYYWRAAIAMVGEEPIFGVGMDSYGNWFRSVRDSDFVSKYGTALQTNSAHNVFLDVASSGGIVLFLSYLAISLLVFYAGLKLLLKAREYDALNAGLLAVWLAWLAQSLVSINQISVAIWGWLVGGAILGRYLYGDRDLPERRDYVAERISASAAMVGISGLFTGLALGLPLFLKDMQYKSALDSTRLEKVIEVSRTFPSNDLYLSQTAEILRSLNQGEVALQVAKEAITLNPRSFASWNLIFDLSLPESKEHQDAQEKLRALDPHNPKYR